MGIIRYIKWRWHWIQNNICIEHGQFLTYDLHWQETVMCCSGCDAEAKEAAKRYQRELLAHKEAILRKYAHDPKH